MKGPPRRRKGRSGNINVGGLILYSFLIFQKDGGHISICGAGFLFANGGGHEDKRALKNNLEKKESK